MTTKKLQCPAKSSLPLAASGLSVALQQCLGTFTPAWPPWQPPAGHVRMVRTSARRHAQFGAAGARLRWRRGRARGPPSLGTATAGPPGNTMTQCLPRSYRGSRAMVKQVTLQQFFTVREGRASVREWPRQRREPARRRRRSVSAVAIAGDKERGKRGLRTFWGVRLRLD